MKPITFFCKLLIFTISIIPTQAQANCQSSITLAPNVWNSITAPCDGALVGEVFG